MDLIFPASFNHSVVKIPLTSLFHPALVRLLNPREYDSSYTNETLFPENYLPHKPVVKVDLMGAKYLESSRALTGKQYINVNFYYY